MAALNLKVNGKDHTVSADQASSLLSVLRDNLHLTGAKAGCGEGQCGACTVLVGGRAIRSCITSLSEVGAHPVQTIEGLSQGSTLHLVQQAFLDQSAFQCGFCTPGMIMASVALLGRIPDPSVNEIRRELDGNVCRCGAYGRIIKAVRLAAKGIKNA
jgi:aerobic-type carbon monoxide dehydrogenase small subunit (CoxS/CutS family)